MTNMSACSSQSWLFVHESSISDQSRRMDWVQALKAYHLDRGWNGGDCVVGTYPKPTWLETRMLSVGLPRIIVFRCLSFRRGRG